MSWSAEIAAAKRELKTLLARGLAQAFLWTLTAKASAIGDDDAVESGDDGVDPGAPPNEQKGQRKVIRVQPWGFNGAPPKKLRSLSLRLGSSNLFWIGIGPTQAYGPQNLNPGETAIYAQPGQVFYLDSNGNLIGTPAGSGTFQAGGNTYSMPQWDAFAAVLKSATAAVAALTAATDLASAILAINGTLTALKTLNTALGVNNNYKSTLAKNG